MSFFWKSSTWKENYIILNYISTLKENYFMKSTKLSPLPCACVGSNSVLSDLRNVYI